MDTFKEDERRIRESGVRKVFTPSTPIRDENLFKGRQRELRQLLQSINTPGQHAILYGDRGVGKSSLANIVSKHIVDGSSMTLIVKRCDSHDTFRTIVEKLLQAAGVDTKLITQSKTKQGEAKVYVVGGSISNTDEIAGIQKDMESPSWVCEQVKDLEALFVIDEFDSIISTDEKHKIAEFIKQLSDSNSSLKILIVGIADTTSELIAGHQSVQRCLTEIKLNKMSLDELIEIIRDGSTTLGLEFDKYAITKIARVSSGYPYFTHLLALRASEQAIINESKTVTLDDLKVATENAIFDCENSLKVIYNTATSYNKNLSKKILYAAVLCNEEFIRAADLRHKYKEIFNEDINQNTMNTYLPQLVGPDKILRRLSNGVYRFADPRMISFIRIAQYEMEDILKKDEL